MFCLTIIFPFDIHTAYASEPDIGAVISFGGSEQDEFHSIEQTSDGGLIAVGKSQSTNGDIQGLNKGGFDAISVKYNATRNQQWANSFGGSGSDDFLSVIEMKDGSLVAIGTTNSNDGDLPNMYKGGTTGIYVKYDGNGIVQWKHSFGSSGYDSFRSVIEIQDGGLLIAGYVKGSNGGSS